MIGSKTYKINFIVTIALLLLYIVTFIVDWFTLKNIAIFSAVMCTLTLSVLFIIFRKINPVYYLSAAAFAFFALFLGMMLNFYIVIPIFDLMLHAASGLLAVFAGHFLMGLVLKREKSFEFPLKFVVAFCIFFSISIAGLWEIWEFSTDYILKRFSQLGSLTDTMTDMIAGSISALIGGFILYILLKKNIISEFESNEE